jgi:hypothetical protein
MLRIVVTIVAVVCLGAHSLLGCCLQHIWHDTGREAAVAQAARHDHAASHACCHHDHSQPAQNHGPCPCKCECRQTCNFVATPKVDCQASDAVGLVVILTSAEILTEQLSATAFHNSAKYAQVTALPLRTHLLHQVLLV